MTKAGRPEAKLYSKILLVVTPESPAETLLDAANLAERHGADLVAFSCLEAPSDRTALERALGLPPDQLLQHLVEDRRRQVEDMIAEAKLTVPNTVEIRIGKPFIETIHYVLAEDVDLVIKSAEPLSGVQRFLFASTDHHLVRKCPCPVWLQMHGSQTAPRTILAAVDVDEWDATEPETLRDLNQRVLETALGLAGDTDAVVYALHAWDAVGEGMIWAFASGADARLAADIYTNGVLAARQTALETLIRSFDQNAVGGRTPRIIPRLARGPADEVIADQVRALKPDLLVLGTVARTGVSGVIIGNTAEDILNRVDCSIVAVKPSSFKSPLQ
ncbi:MAG: universal stress protein [Pseudomonadota bacterium]